MKYYLVFLLFFIVISIALSTSIVPSDYYDESAGTEENPF